ncbi:cytochrome-c peroxidase [Adhaeribacter arboris]|uniref:Cytochrome-c peroxidase n=1 Tax=Adhaeribacter arboris TaxID=2072846 RepID=A0A2T2YNR2_9BACT|nr:cytochrome c peroxidase [Adhaeribacter arboris]PSR57153.1 cytochrome-c peroxidase [Adhaeribacter arboris]
MVRQVWKQFCHLSFLVVSCGITACNPEPVVPTEGVNAQLSYFPEPVYQYQNNPLTRVGFELGRKLFYDPILSEDGSISCGSCHKQFAAFADLEHSVSHGLNNQLGTRNTPALANLRWNPNFFWDGGVNHLELVPLAPITNPVEMGSNVNSIIRKLNRDPGYVTEFRKVFHQDSVNSQQLFRALAQFTGELISASAPYDQYVNGKTDALTAEQKQGLLVFEAKCSACHKPGLFTDHSFRNNGLNSDFKQDPGRRIITDQPTDEGKFKVPSLRNVTVSSPYMHDGRFRTLVQVLEHYAKGVKTSATLDPLLAGANPGIALSDEEKKQLLAFLEALTDKKFITDPRFADPF